MKGNRDGFFFAFEGNALDQKGRQPGSLVFVQRPHEIAEFLRHSGHLIILSQAASPRREYDAGKMPTVLCTHF